jgi:hypothetical protein
MEGGWGEWGRLVLGELARLTTEVSRLDRDVRDVAQGVGILKANAVDAAEMERRIAALEAAGSITIQKNEDRKWLIGLAILVVASILLPSLRVVLGGA